MVADFYVLCHRVVNDSEVYQNLYSGQNLKNIIKALWALRLNRGPDMLPFSPYMRIMVVKDEKFSDINNYWRQRAIAKDERMEFVWEYFWENHPRREKTSQAYKGTRGDKSDFFKLVSSIGQEYCNQVYNTYFQEGYEADDIAGAIYRYSRDNDSVARKRQILFLTNDRDWGQLVSDEHKCYWANTRYPFANEAIQHRIAGNKEVIEHTLHKHGVEIEHPKELVKVKTINGDLGDNLPPGTPTDYMDLCEVPRKWMPELLDWWEFCVDRDLNNDEPNIQTSHYISSWKALSKIGALPMGDYPRMG